jgi:hypothetical protein
MHTIVNGNENNVTMNQTDVAIFDSFYSMKEGKEYVLSNFWLNETDSIAGEHGAPPLDPDTHRFTRAGSLLLGNKKQIFDFDGQDNLALRLAYALSALDEYADSAFGIVTAFMYGAINKAGDKIASEVIQVGGKRYKLTPI